MMLVEPDPVIAEAVELFPGLEVLGIGPRRDLRVEMFARQRIRQLVADLQMLELLPVSQQIKDEHLHSAPLAIPRRGASLGAPQRRFNGFPPRRRSWGQLVEQSVADVESEDRGRRFG